MAKSSCGVCRIYWGDVVTLHRGEGWFYTLIGEVGNMKYFQGTNMKSSKFLCLFNNCVCCAMAGWGQMYAFQPPILDHLGPPLFTDEKSIKYLGGT
jgi:hypothetical protein